MKLESGLIAIDDGGHSTCVATKKIIDRFPSVKGLYGNRNLTETNGRHDFIVDYEDKKYVMGTLAQHDCKYPLQMHIETKCHIFFRLSVLVAIHQYGYAVNYLITSVPIKSHKEEEKFNRIKELVGEHTVTVNGNRKRFTIMDMKVAPETAVAYWMNEPLGKARFIDLGSRTIGYATTFNDGETNRFIDTESGTFKDKGLEALGEDYDQEGLADYICGHLSAIWNKNDTVYLLGGGALDKELVSNIQRYFSKAVIMDNPQMVNVLSMYRLGMVAFNMA